MKAYSVLILLNGLAKLRFVSAASVEDAKRAAVNRFGGVVLGVTVVS